MPEYLLFKMSVHAKCYTYISLILFATPNKEKKKKKEKKLQGGKRLS
jgi:hypothetical protein